MQYVGTGLGPGLNTLQREKRNRDENKAASAISKVRLSRVEIAGLAAEAAAGLAEEEAARLEKKARPAEVTPPAEVPPPVSRYKDEMDATPTEEAEGSGSPGSGKSLPEVSESEEEDSGGGKLLATPAPEARKSLAARLARTPGPSRAAGAGESQPSTVGAATVAASNPGGDFWSRLKVKDHIGGGNSLAAGAAARAKAAGHKGLTMDINSPDILDQIATRLRSLEIGDKGNLIIKFSSIHNRLNSFLIKIHSEQIYIPAQKEGPEHEEGSEHEERAIERIEEDIKFTQKIIEGLIDGHIPKDETQTPITNVEEIIEFLKTNLNPPPDEPPLDDDQIMRILSYDTEESICQYFYRKGCVEIFTHPPPPRR
jgi:hypothetical protein